ncbi:conserved hypothetical protein [Cupriavidus taiwanensis]|uniref:PoNe immunity protein domain-containing protein n=1 Tax=Cupriavidus taiwanensis TaxID=164546 RepID=UPI000E159383|nr:PoNe immunity protein domain-containing protein [Cupriavidus taiwanensis]SOY97638.1 conserved hypothetical protein [Cupriavidus taiwanensis]SOZ00295.1 conserved hypothetical protein [Cupriavidus taiwanensis]
MAERKQPSLLPSSASFKNSRRQQFLYEPLYENVRARLIEGIEACKDNVRLKQNHPHPGYLRDAQGGLYEEMFWLWMLDYTAGADLDHLAREFASIVEEFCRWNELNIPYRLYLKEKFKDRGDTELTICSVDFFNQIEYENALQLLSIAILIRDGRSIKRIIAAMASNRYRDALYEQLIVDFVPDPQDDMDEVIFAEPYATLVEAYFQQDPTESIRLIKHYLKAWYRYQDGARWYDGHKKIQNDESFYYGYWAFEAGATSYLLDIDDSGIDHMVYPKDLVAYGRQLREKNIVTSDFSTPLDSNDYPLSRLRCDSGQPCPQAGWWMTPAKIKSRRWFAKDEMMPDIKDSDFGATIWQWDMDQSGRS